jgi:hypothetical protein
MIAERAEKYFSGDLAIEILTAAQIDAAQINLVRRRLPGYKPVESTPAG